MASSEQLAELLSRSARGERGTFERLYRETSARLYGLLLAILRDRETASEALQEGFIKIWINAGSFNPEKATPMVWMESIMRHQAIDLMRRNAARPRPAAPPQDLDRIADEVDDPVENTALALQVRRLYQCLAKLPEREFSALMLAYFADLTQEELAARLKKPLGTVKSWTRRGVLRLRANYY